MANDWKVIGGTFIRTTNGDLWVCPHLSVKQVTRMIKAGATFIEVVPTFVMEGSPRILLSQNRTYLNTSFILTMRHISQSLVDGWEIVEEEN